MASALNLSWMSAIKFHGLSKPRFTIILVYWLALKANLSIRAKKHLLRAYVLMNMPGQQVHMA